MEDEYSVRLQRIEDEGRNERKETRHMILDVQQSIGLMQQSLVSFERSVDAKFKIMDDKIDPVVAAYNGLIFGNKIVISVSALILAIGTIAAAGLWAFHSLVHRP